MKKKKKIEYYAPWPLDYRLLAMVPEEGTIGGVHWKGRRSADLVAELNHEEEIRVTSAMVSARLRAMQAAGYTKAYGGSGNKKVWAKTPAGVKFEKEQHNG